MFVFEHYNPARRKCLQSNEIRFIGRCLVYLGLVWGCGMHAFYSRSNMNLSRRLVAAGCDARKGTNAVCVGTGRFYKTSRSGEGKSETANNILN